MNIMNELKIESLYCEKCTNISIYKHYTEKKINNCVLNNECKFCIQKNISFFERVFIVFDTIRDNKQRFNMLKNIINEYTYCICTMPIKFLIKELTKLFECILIIFNSLSNTLNSPHECCDCMCVCGYHRYETCRTKNKYCFFCYLAKVNFSVSVDEFLLMFRKNYELTENDELFKIYGHTIYTRNDVLECVIAFAQILCNRLLVSTINLSLHNDVLDYISNTFIDNIKRLSSDYTCTILPIKKENSITELDAETIVDNNYYLE
jgi:hypothetical protein